MAANELTQAIEKESTENHNVFESAFGPSNRAYDVVDTGEGGEHKVYPHTFHHEVYTIYRPWNECPRCWDAYKEKAMVLPENSDVVCPHTRMGEYKAQMQQFYKGGHLQLSRKEDTLKNGTIQVSLAWTVPDKKEGRPAPTKKTTHRL